jgi:transcriptional regulator with XRE-family HTH domain
MGSSDQIRAFRVRAGKTKAEMVERLGLNAAWYEDLERNDDELASTLTLFQAMELASVLAVTVRELMAGDAVPDELIPLLELPDRIREHMSRDGISIEQLEDQVGCELRLFLDSPLLAAAEHPLRCLQGIARYLGINWLALVPDEHAA